MRTSRSIKNQNDIIICSTSIIYDNGIDFFENGNIKAKELVKSENYKSKEVFIETYEQPFNELCSKIINLIEGEDITFNRIEIQMIKYISDICNSRANQLSQTSIKDSISFTLNAKMLAAISKRLMNNYDESYDNLNSSDLLHTVEMKNDTSYIKLTV